MDEKRGGARRACYNPDSRECRGRKAKGMARSGSKYVEGMYRLAEQWPYLRYLGMGAWWAWIWLCYSDTGLFVLWPQGSFARQVGFMYLCSTPAIMCTLLLAALLWRRVTPLLGRRGCVLGVSACAALGVGLIAVAPLLGAGVAEWAAFAVGAVLTGVGTSVLALKTGDAYSALGRREVLTAGSIALVFAAFLYFVGIGLPPLWQPFFIAAMPVASALLFVMPGDDPFPADELSAVGRGAHVPGMRSYVRLVVASGLVAFTAGFARGLASGSMADTDYAQVGVITTFAICVAALAVCIVVNSGDVVRAVRRVYAVLIFFGMVVVLGSTLGLDLVYTSIGKELLWMIFTCLMAYAAFRFGFSSVRAFGIGQAVYLGLSACSWGFGLACAPLDDSAMGRVAVAVALALTIVVVFAFVFTDADIKFIFTWRHDDVAADTGVPAQNGAGTQTDGGPTVAERIAALPERFGVSARERQITELFAEGHSANWIAEDLVISKNTVRSHIRSIYTKLDVHSRRELLDFLATVEVEPEKSTRP